MERTPVTSTDIRTIGYDADSQTLVIEFNSSGVYQYSSVTYSFTNAYRFLMLAWKYFPLESAAMMPSYSPEGTLEY